METHMAGSMVEFCSERMSRKGAAAMWMWRQWGFLTMQLHRKEFHDEQQEWDDFNRRHPRQVVSKRSALDEGRETPFTSGPMWKIEDMCLSQGRFVVLVVGSPHWMTPANIY